MHGEAGAPVDEIDVGAVLAVVEGRQVLLERGGRGSGELGLDVQVLQGGQGLVLLEEGAGLEGRPAGHELAYDPAVVAGLGAAPPPYELLAKRREARHALLPLPGTCRENCQRYHKSFVAGSC